LTGEGEAATFLVMALIDLSHVVEAGMTTYPGLPGPIVCDYLSREESRKHYAEGTSFQIAKIELVANTGTYVDSPFHRYEDGVDLADLALTRLANLEVVKIDVDADPALRAIDSERFAGLDLAGRALLVHTGWSRHFRTPAYLEGHPFLTRSASEALVRSGVAFVGIDSLNIDDITDGARPAHTLLLGAGIPIGEHFTNLGALPSRGARLHAAPVKMKGVGTFPVRAYAVVPD
jgi:arylformamidase